MSASAAAALNDGLSTASKAAANVVSSASRAIMQLDIAKQSTVSEITDCVNKALVATAAAVGSKC